jgi:hypothetical protein
LDSTLLDGRREIGRPPRVRAALWLLLLSSPTSSPVLAAKEGTLTSEAALPNENRALLPPRWRVQVSLLEGFGGSWDHGSVSAFPTTLAIGVRVWGPLSVTAGATGVLSGDHYESCGGPRRANAIVGHAGLRVDFNNKHGDSWLDPFIEAHGGVGGQRGGRDACGAGGVFGTGGARVGLDVWMGRAAITVAAGFDYTPVATPAAGFLGATFLLK